VEFSKQTIAIENRNDIHQLLHVSSLKNHVVVNIAGSAEAKPIPLSEENLRAILDAAPKSLYVEALPFARFDKLMRDVIDQVIQSLLDLRSALRTQHVADLAAQIRDFLPRLDPILLLLQCYALQNTRSGVEDQVRKLESLRAQFVTSVFEHGDNVRCMDDLQYQILPALKLLLKIFRK
jgi:hypothetical protein